MELVFTMLVPFLMLGVALWGLVRRVDLWSALVEGAGEGLQVSLRIVAQAAVVSIFPVIEADAPARNASSPSLVSSARPAARRMLASGLMYRKKAMVLKISSSVSCGWFSRGVPGIGIRALIGMESIPSSARLTAISSRSSQVSPIPMIPPEQAHIPSALTSFRVSTFWS